MQTGERLEHTRRTAEFPTMLESAHRWAVTGCTRHQAPSWWELRTFRERSSTQDTPRFGSLFPQHHHTSHRQPTPNGADRFPLLPGSMDANRSSANRGERESDSDSDSGNSVDVQLQPDSTSRNHPAYYWSTNGVGVGNFQAANVPAPSALVYVPAPYPPYIGNFQAVNVPAPHVGNFQAANVPAPAALPAPYPPHYGGTFQAVNVPPPSQHSAVKKGQKRSSSLSMAADRGVGVGNSNSSVSDRSRSATYWNSSSLTMAADRGVGVDHGGYKEK